MNRPSKKEIAARIEQLKGNKSEGQSAYETPSQKPSGKKPNKNRIRKQGV